MEKKEYKAKIRIPLKEYSYIELDAEGTTEDLKDTYDEMMSMNENGLGLPNKQWVEARDAYLNGQPLDPEVYESMNQYQKDWIQETKRGINNINRKLK